MAGVLSFKVYLYENEASEEREIRRFGIDTDVATSYDYLREKLQTVFPTLRQKPFKIHWKDSEGDPIIISSDEELILALNEPTLDPVHKLHVTLQSDNHSESSAFQSNVIHIGVTCDGCCQTVRGFRFKCLQCADFDLCNNCHNQGMHVEHCMIRLSTPLQARPHLTKRFLRHVNRFAKKHTCPRDEDSENKDEAESDKPCDFENKRGGRRRNKPACPVVADLGDTISHLVNFFAEGATVSPENQAQGGEQSNELKNQSNGQPQQKGNNEGQSTSNNSHGEQRAEVNIFPELNLPKLDQHFELLRILGQNLSHFMDPLGLNVTGQDKPTDNQQNNSGDKTNIENNGSNSTEKTPKSDEAATPVSVASNASNSDNGSCSTPESFHSYNQNAGTPNQQNIGFVIDKDNRSEEEWTFVKEVPIPTSQGSSSSSTPRQEAPTNLPSAPLEATPTTPAPKPQKPSNPPTAGIYPNLPKEKEVYHSDPKIQGGVEKMIEMGFSNKDNQLTNLLVAKDGDIVAVLDILQNF